MKILLRQQRVSFFILSLAVMICGCADVKYYRISDDKEDAKSCTSGLRYFDTSTYFLLQHDTNDPTGKAFSTQILYLPDETKKNQAQVRCFLAVNTSSFTFSNAVLTDTTISTDTSVVPVAIINALESALSGAASAGKLFADYEAPVKPEKTKKYPDPDVEMFKVVGGKDNAGHEAYGLIGAFAGKPSNQK
jgi:hypothetical protein